MTKMEKRNTYIKDQFNALYRDENYGDMGTPEAYDKIIEDAMTAESTPSTNGDVHTLALRIWEVTSCHTMEEIEQSVYDILSTANQTYGYPKQLVKDEMKIRRALDQYDDAMAELERVHNERRNNVYVNESGEAYATDILELGMWRTQRETEIKRAFIEALA